jgi:hypothetical protein
MTSQNTTTKHVRFNTTLDTIAYTHSSIEYDRSPFKDAALQLYTLRQNIQDSYTSSSSYTTQPMTTKTTTNNKKTPPLLKINTSLLGNKGPLFLTNLSTNYYKFVVDSPSP